MSGHPDPDPGPASMPVRACSLADLADESAIGVEIGGEPVCVVRSAGRVYAVRDICSHAEVMLSQGDVDDGQIECWLHGSQFDLETGVPTCLPAIEPVPVYAVTVEGGDVFVDLAAAGGSAPMPIDDVPTTRK